MAPAKRTRIIWDSYKTVDERQFLRRLKLRYLDKSRRLWLPATPRIAPVLDLHERFTVYEMHGETANQRFHFRAEESGLGIDGPSIEYADRHHAKALVVVVVKIGLEALDPQFSCVGLSFLTNLRERELSTLKVTPDGNLQGVKWIDVRMTLSN